MSIKDELTAELKDAMRARDRDRLDVVRQITTEVSRVMTEPGHPAEADDALYLKVIGAYVKKMNKALEEFDNLGERGRDASAKLRFEVEYLSRWLPRAASEADTAAIVDAAIAELGASDSRQLGRVVGHIMKNSKGLDGALVNRLVRDRLGA